MLHVHARVLRMAGPCRVCACTAGYARPRAGAPCPPAPRSADPHPGNVAVDTQGKLIYYDVSGLLPRASGATGVI